MNIPIAKKAKTEEKKKQLSYGLNPRAASSAATTSVFGGDDDDDDGDDVDDEEVPRHHRGVGARPNQRSRVNAELAREQAAIRRRVEEELQQQRKQGDGVSGRDGDPSHLDYDGAYETFRSSEGGDLPKSSVASSQPEAPPPQSRYLGGLLKAAEERKRERELFLERKIVREQEQEAKDEGAEDKPQFVTAAYRRKLEEREAWVRDKKAREEQEAAADVTKGDNAGVAMAYFYARLHRNVALGGGSDGGGRREEEEAPSEWLAASLDGETDRNRGASASRAEGGTGSPVESSAGSVLAPASRALKAEAPDPLSFSSSLHGDGASVAVVSLRAARRDKVRQARLRYFERHPERRRPDSVAAAL